jgi:ELWxxDGT repeat protein
MKSSHRPLAALIGAIVMFALPGAAAASTPEQLSDAHGTAGSSPSSLAATGKSVYFAANDGVNGTELWKSDGGGAEMVKDIAPSAASSNPNSMVAIGETVYFAANDGVNGTELWKSDGTEEGTVMVENINPSGNSAPVTLTPVGEKLFFQANNGTNGKELWVSEGTEENTLMVEDISGGGGSSTPANFVDNQGTLYFVATNPAHGYEPWKSDGTEAGTEIVRDIIPGSVGSSNPSSPANTLGAAAPDGTFYFSATDNVHGNELWKSDGTAEGTVEVEDSNPGAPSSTPFSIRTIGSDVYYSAIQPGIGREPWKSDGSSAALIMDINAGSANSSATGFTAIGPTVYFTATDGVNGSQVWRTEGKEADTAMVATIGSSGASLLKNVEGALYFRATGEHGVELWRSNGTEAGTVEVRDIAPGGESSEPAELVALDGKVFFTANDKASGTEVWRTDGSPIGTARVADVNQVSAPPAVGVSEITAMDGAIYFTAADVNGAELWRSDGTPAGTSMLIDINPGGPSSSPAKLTDVGGGLFCFQANDGSHGVEPWCSNGTAEGTEPLGDVNPGPTDTYPTGFAGLGGNVFFRAFTPATGFELWKSEGSEGGTSLLADIGPGAENGVPPFLLNGLPPTVTSLGGKLLFSASNGVDGYELWRSDGTEEGTVMVKDINPTGDSEASWIAGDPLDGDLLFEANDGENGFELWRTDGTEEGTVMVKDIREAEGSSFPVGFTDFKDESFFRAEDGEAGSELWRTDGTPGGTSLVKDVNPGTNGSFPAAAAVSGGTLFIVASDSETGSELWRSDGTEGGTNRVKDVNPGPQAGALAWLADVGGTLFFTGNDGENGFELWESDGSEGGTEMVADINPGSLSSQPMDLTESDGSLYFGAQTGASPLDTQLWGLSSEPGVPDVETQPASELGRDKATLNGSLDGDGQSVTYHFEWGVDETYGQFTPERLSEGSGPVSVSEGLSELEPNTEYHYRLVAVNASGESFGDDVAFTTLPGLKASLEGPSLVLSTKARLGGFAIPGGAGTVVDCHYEYGFSAAYGSSIPCAPPTPYNEYTYATADLTGLTPDTTYHFMLVLSNESETVQTADQIFHTSADHNATFSPAAGAPFAVDQGPYALASGDLNGDGDGDLAVTNYFSNELTVLLGDGSGGFAEAAGSPFGAAVNGPQSVAIGDVNGDSKPDLATAGRSDNKVAVFFGNGAGGFNQAPGSPFSSLGTSPVAVALADLDGDSKRDLAVLNGNSNSVAVFLNTGAGSFSPIASNFVSGVGTAMDVEDLDGDTDADIVVAHNGQGTVSVLLGNGAGEFAAAPGGPFSVGGTNIGPWDVEVGDLNGDGKPDVATSNVSGNGLVSVLLGDGAGGFSPAVGSPFGGSSSEHYSLAIADVNLDGKPDLTTVGFRTHQALTLLGDGSGGFAPDPEGPIGIGAGPAEVVTDDFNGDLKPDLAVANFVSEDVSVLLNTTPGYPNDSDGDGIGNDLDPEPGVASDAFSDGEGTSGSIVDRNGLVVRISDEVAPEGVRVIAGPGAGQATLSVCGGAYKVKISAGSEILVTCGSVQVSVVEGEAEIVLGDEGEIVIGVPAGGSAKATVNNNGTVTVENLGSQPVAVTVEGNETSLPAGQKQTVADVLDPETTIASGPTGPTKDSTPKFTFTSSDTGSSFQCRFDAAAFAACSSGSSHTAPSPLGEGAHTFEVRAKDKAGHTDPTPASRSFTVDTLVPETTIDSGPSGPTTNPSPTFAFSSNEAAATFECKLDAAVYAACSSPLSLGPLAEGAHTFRVRALDAAGNVDKSPATSSFTVDSVVPDTAIDSGPSGPSKDATPKFHFTSTESGSSFQCRFDAAAFAACSSGSSHTAPSPLGEGAHTFEVRAIDKAGNADPSPASRSFSVDTLVPETTIDAGPSGPTPNASPVFAFSSNEPAAGFECKLDSDPWVACGSPRSLGPLADGNHTFRVRALDAAGNVDKSPATSSFSVDTTIPDTAIDTGPSGPTKTATPKFHFTSTESGVSFQCRIDGGPFGACSGPGANHTPASPLGEGAHTFEVRAIDKAGNADPSPASRSFSVDTLDPETTIDSGPTGTITSSSATFTFHSNEPAATFECKLDSAAWAVCTSPRQLTGLAKGAHTFNVRALDAAGNVDASPAQGKFTKK